MPETPRCTKCGVEMIHHADKPDWAATGCDPGAADPDLGCVSETLYRCPRCGEAATRRQGARQPGGR